MKFHKQRRSVYWSSNKVFSWMLPDAQPFTFDMLKEQIATGIDRRPLLERIIDKFQDIVMFPLDLIYSVKVNIENSKGSTHVLSGGLEKGQWYDLTYRIPVCLFTELEKFIEQEKGLEVHQWEMGLRYSEEYGIDSNSPKYGKLTDQAIAAIEQNEIYVWWKDNKDNTDGCDEQYEKEEQEMLIRLVKIYRSLWT